MKKSAINIGKRRILITTPIYYVNDKPHIGHAYTTLAADVLTRFFKTQGKEVFFLTGTDEHGSKITASAQKMGKLPKQLCDENSELYKKAWQNLDIQYDYFIRTTDARHEKAVQTFVEQLNKRGVIYKKNYEGLYCVGCEKFLTAKELDNGLCIYHKTKPQTISEQNYFFKLENYLSRVKQAIVRNKLKIQPVSARQELLGLFKQGLDDFSISRQEEKVSWGIKMPFDDKQTVYVWVDALLNYISALGYVDDQKEFKKWWLDSHVIHLLGRDILKFHAVYWPAMLIASKIKMPDQEFIHGFFTINGEKMSKTIGNVINPDKLINQFGSDATRYLLLCQFPFGNDGDVKEAKFTEQYNADLANGIGNLTERIFALLRKYNYQMSGRQSAAKGFRKIILAHEKKYYYWMNRLDLCKALESAFALVKDMDKYINETKPWQSSLGGSEEIGLILTNLISGLAKTVDFLEPFMPAKLRLVKKRINDGDFSGINLFPRITR